MNNLLIRHTLTESGLKYWQLARLLNISEATLSRRLRDELSEDEQERIASLIRANAERNCKDGKNN